MPHVIVKLWPSKSEPQKQKLAESITRAVMTDLGYGADSVSVSFEEVASGDWTEKVYQPDILNGSRHTPGRLCAVTVAVLKTPQFRLPLGKDVLAAESAELAANARTQHLPLSASNILLQASLQKTGHPEQHSAWRWIATAFRARISGT